MTYQSPSRTRFSRSDWGAVAATTLYILPALGISLRRGNQEFVLYVAVLIILLAAVAILHRRMGLHPLAIWGLSLWGLAHMLGGLAPIPHSWTVTPGNAYVLYNWWIIPDRLKFDQVVHAYGFGLTTWICWQALHRAFADRGVPVQPTVGLVALCAAAGMGFGALNEVVEFIATLLIPETNVGGYVNTGWDLVSNMAGAVIAAGLIWVGGRHQNDPA